MQRILFLSLMAAGFCFAQGPEVHPDRTVTFHWKSPNAKEVVVNREGLTKLPMQQDEKGIWTATTEPLDPDYYGYTFLVDGVTTMDTANPLMKPNLLGLSNMVHVPGPPDSAPWEMADVPHGEVHRHFYKSGVIGDDRDYYVYTPPGYKSGTKYPVLYLLHGFSDDASGWTAVGRANVILDNLIAAGKARPMLVVMTLGYGAPEIVHASGRLRDPAMRQKNYDRYRDALFTEVIPKVEAEYSVSKDRKSRAIAGLSMGGAESLYVGLNAIDRFAWVGSFSAGGLSEDYDTTFPHLNAKTGKQLELLWIACGTEDALIAPNRKLREWLKTRDVKAVEIETPGAHTWLVWRRNLAAFTPLLFPSK